VQKRVIDHTGDSENKIKDAVQELDENYVYQEMMNKSENEMVFKINSKIKLSQVFIKMNQLIINL